MESVVFQKTVIESIFDYGIEAKYEYWIVHIESTNEIIFPLINSLVRQRRERLTWFDCNFLRCSFVMKPYVFCHLSLQSMSQINLNGVR